MVDDDEPAYVRAHRAKRRIGVRDIDGGAIAGGFLIVLVGFAITIVFPSIGHIGAAIVAGSLVAGGFVAARLAASQPIVHGLGVAVLLIVLVLLVSLSTVLAEAEETRIIVLSGEPSTNIAGMLLATILSGLGSVLGRNG